MAKKQGQEGGLRDFTLVEGFRGGYRNREDITVLPPGVLVEGSQNVLTNTFQRVGIRKGYTLDGAANTDLAPIAASFDWFTSKGQERNMRAGFLTSAANDGKLQYRYVASDGTVSWRDLLTSLTSVAFNFTTFWDFTTEKLDLMLAVNGTAGTIWEWSGGITTLSAATNDTVVSMAGNSASLTTYGAPTATAPITTATNNLVGASLQAYFIFTGNPTNGQNLVLNINGATQTFTFVTTIGVTEGNILIGATAADTAANFLDLLQNPGTTDANHVALSGANQTIIGYTTDTSTTGTLTKTGTTSWAEEGFYIAGTRGVTINGTAYTYTGGEFSTTLTGVSPDPSGEGAASVVHQTPRTQTSFTDLPTTISYDLISNLYNQVYIGSFYNGDVYISAVNDYLTYSFSTPRIVGEGALITTTSPPTAFIPQESSMYITAGTDEWYETTFTLSSDNAKESLSVQRLNTTRQQASMSQAATSKIANSVVYLSFEPIVNTFGRVDNVVLTPQITDISFPIVNDMDAYDFTNASLFYFKKFVYLAVPAEGIVRMYNMTDPRNPYWEAPQILPIARFSIIGGELYGHSSLVSETYKLFSGYNDNGNSVAAVAKFSFNNYGTRSTSKSYNQFFTEGYITSNTNLTVGIQYDIDGCATSTSRTLSGTNKKFVCIGGTDNSLGKNSLGKQPLGSFILSASAALPPKFRWIPTFTIRYFYEDQISFSSTGKDQQWEIICFGPQLLSARDLNNSITE